MKLCHHITFQLISYQMLSLRKDQLLELRYRNMSAQVDLGKVCGCLELPVESAANLLEGSLQFYYLSHCSLHFRTPLHRCFQVRWEIEGPKCQ